jgi:hypothetical protein
LLPPLQEHGFMTFISRHLAPLRLSKALGNLRCLAHA